MSLISRIAAAAGMRPRPVGRPRHAPARDTELYPRLQQIGFGNTRHSGLPAFRPTPRNLRYFSRTPYARRAINAIKNPIAMLDWEIVPAFGQDWNSELKRQAALVTTSLRMPNQDDDWRSFIEQVIEDLMHGAGAIEVGIGGDPVKPLWLWPVDGLSIQIFPLWDGKASSPRYVQALGYGGLTSGAGDGVPLSDAELLYIRPNPTTAQPFGLGPLEVAFESISRQLGAAEYAGNLATNARPSVLLHLGEAADQQAVAKFRSYWRNEIEGQATLPIIAGHKEAKAISLHADGDAALYLEWQNFLKREIATAFDLSPQNLGVEADVNRNTSETAEDRDWDQAIKPWAHLVSSSITRHAVNRRLGFTQLEMRFKGLDREDEQATAEIYELHYQNNLITPNEHRRRLGWEPSPSPTADMLFSDAAQAAAEQTAQLTATLTTQDGTGNGPTPSSRQKSRLGKRQSKEG